MPQANFPSDRAPLDAVADYYGTRIRTEGPTHLGVDWNSAQGQTLRFSQLLRLTEPDERPFSIDDYGCGYGALLDHLRKEGREADYLGLDVAEPMIAAARAAHPEDAERFRLGSSSPRQADYAVASGIFNVRLDTAVADWEDHIQSCLDAINAASTRGFAFNCLSSYSDPPYRKGHLYYGDPRFYSDLCVRRYGYRATLIHDYGLYEFTLLVQKADNR